ncbi:MAG: exo-alpha-sialidase [Planctomycetes bacterium]|nr:exo-alpha-sialidase [Planctomycetota bacterium]NOG56067.1 exo-alpha-sialidase [Planctomycetota bacterium]
MHNRHCTRTRSRAAATGTAISTACLILSSTGFAQEPIIGPQIRIDVNGGVEAANETTISSIHMNPNEVVAGWNDWRESTGFSEIIRMGVAVSNDGGQTWEDFLLRAPSGHQSTVEGDPMTCYDNRTGTLWAGAMSWTGSGGVYVARKRPGENTFDDPVMTYVYGGIDKGWMAAGVDPFDPNATRVYVTYNLGNQYSTDMGQTWTNPRSLGSGIGFLPRVGPNGELYVAYWDYGSGVMLARSFDGGQSFEPAVRIATRMDTWSTQDGSRFPGSFRVPPLNSLAVDPNNGTVYSVYFDTTDWSGGYRNVDLYFSKSTDQGANWTTPRVINSDSNPAGDQFFPWIEVDERGWIHMVFYDTRHTVQADNAPHGMFDAYYALSTDGGDTWREYRLTPNSFDSYYDGLDRGSSQFLGDYLGLAVGGNKVYPCYLSTQNGDSDTFSHVITLPVLEMMKPIPGVSGQDNTFEVHNATPGEAVHFVYGLRQGSVNVPGCSGLTVSVRNPTIMGSAVADASGIASLGLFVPGNAGGRTIYLQGVERGTCQVSNLLPFVFE